MSCAVPLAYWVHDLSPFILRFNEAVGLRWYGLSYALGFLFALAMLRLYIRRGRLELQPERLDVLFVALVVGVLAGGRLGYVLLYDFPAFIERPWILFAVWRGGMASHGGFLGVALAVYATARYTGVSFLKLGDALVSVAPAGLMFGRVANFINGELYGKITSAPWAVIFPSAQRRAPYGAPEHPLYFQPEAFTVSVTEAGVDMSRWAVPGLANPRHPSQLYQAGMEGLLLLIYLQVRFWMPGAERRAPGQLAGEFFIGYALMRIAGEVFRAPDASLILGLSRGTFYSWLTLLVGLAILIVCWHRAQKLRL